MIGNLKKNLYGNISYFKEFNFGTFFKELNSLKVLADLSTLQ